MRQRQRQRQWAVLLALTTLLVGTRADIARADVSVPVIDPNHPPSANGAICANKYGHIFDGAFIGDGTQDVFGVSGSLSYTQVLLCTMSGPVPSFTADTGTSYWFMVAGAGQALQYAQIGFFRSHHNPQPLAFTEYNDGRGDEDVQATMKYPDWRYQEFTPAGGFVWDTYYDLGVGLWQGAMQMTFQGTVMARTPWNPADYWARPWNGQLLGEATNPEDNMPGTPGNHARFRNVNGLFSTDGWQRPTSYTNINENTAKYDQAPMPGGLDIWSK